VSIARPGQADCTATVTGSANGHVVNGTPSTIVVDAPTFVSGKVTNQSLAVSGSGCTAVIPNNTAASGLVYFSGASNSAVTLTGTGTNANLVTTAL
jgi:hypothetical protein